MQGHHGWAEARPERLRHSPTTHCPLLLLTASALILQISVDKSGFLLSLAQNLQNSSRALSPFPIRVLGTPFLSRDGACTSGLTGREVYEPTQLYSSGVLSRDMLCRLCQEGEIRRGISEWGCLIPASELPWRTDSPVPAQT